MGSFTMLWPCSTIASLSPAHLQSVQEAGETQVLAPDLQRKCNALKAIQEKVQAAKQHKELKVTPDACLQSCSARLRAIVVASSTSHTWVGPSVPVKALYLFLLSARWA